MDHTAGLCIRRAEDKPRYARKRDRTRAHRARLERDDEARADQALAAQDTRTFADDQELGMRGRVLEPDDAVAIGGDESAGTIEQSGTDRHLAAQRRRLGLPKRDRHGIRRQGHLARISLKEIMPYIRVSLVTRPSHLIQAAAMAETPSDTGERIAKVLARRGVCSRREAEKMITSGLVSVDGVTLTSPAVKVKGGADIRVEGARIPAASATRLWRYHKPRGLITSTLDPQGRATVFAHLPEDLPRVVSIGRLDLNSEGLLLLTNDGELARKLELPSTGWRRRYRVRVHGRLTEDDLARLRKGIKAEGETLKAEEVILDQVRGSNCWLTIVLREGKNREIRRMVEALGAQVDRLIRVAYGPFQLGSLKSGEVEEISRKVMKEQLGAMMGDAKTPPSRAAKRDDAHGRR